MGGRSQSYCALTLLWNENIVTTCKKKLVVLYAYRPMSACLGMRADSKGCIQNSINNRGEENENKR